jgi:hypothetical protein
MRLSARISRLKLGSASRGELGSGKDYIEVSKQENRQQRETYTVRSSYTGLAVKDLQKHTLVLAQLRLVIPLLLGVVPEHLALPRATPRRRGGGILQIAIVVDAAVVAHREGPVHDGPNAGAPHVADDRARAARFDALTRLLPEVHAEAFQRGPVVVIDVGLLGGERLSEMVR